MPIHQLSHQHPAATAAVWYAGGVNVAGTSLQFLDSVKLHGVELDQALSMESFQFFQVLLYIYQSLHDVLPFSPSQQTHFFGRRRTHSAA